MAGVGVISSVAVFLFLLLASFSAARQVRSPRNWAPVGDQTTCKYLVLLNVSNAATCSGSIPSQWTVLTYCAGAKNDGNTKAYAGMLAAADTKPATNDVQERVVKNVVAEKRLTSLKICTLDKSWELGDKVGSISVSKSPGGSCNSLGFRLNASNMVAAHTLTVTEADAASCGLTGAGAAGLFGSAAGTPDLQLDKTGIGGPVVCGDAQRGINKEYNAASADANKCNLYIDIAPHRDWIEGQINATEAEAAGGNGGTGGTGGNGTASSGYSIHSHLNKYSNWKVLWFLVPTIVTFLQY